MSAEHPTAGAGYSGTPLPRKLGIEPGMRMGLYRAPDGFESVLGPLPPDVRIGHRVKRGGSFDLVVGFMEGRDLLARNLDWLLETLSPDGVLWVAWPKKASGVTSDMTDGVIRELALPRGWVDVKVCAIDPTWSGLKLVLRKNLRPTAPRRS